MMLRLFIFLFIFPFISANSLTEKCRVIFLQLTSSSENAGEFNQRILDDTFSDMEISAAQSSERVLLTEDQWLELRRNLFKLFTIPEDQAIHFFKDVQAMGNFKILSGRIKEIESKTKLTETDQGRLIELKNEMRSVIIDELRKILCGLLIAPGIASPLIVLINYKIGEKVSGKDHNQIELYLKQLERSKEIKKIRLLTGVSLLNVAVAHLTICNKEIFNRYIFRAKINSK